MIEIGKWNELEIVKVKDFGVYLADVNDEDDDLDILLPEKQVPNGAKKGDKISVFVYRDSSDRLIATVNKPLITIGEMAVLRCVNVTSIGAFMDWGLEKDILLPFKEQTTKVSEGREYLVRMYKDRSDRLCVSMKLYTELSSNSPYKPGDNVTGIVHEYNKDFGAFVAVDNKYSALIPKREIHSHIGVGDKVEARVYKVREDGKLDITISKPINEQIDIDSEMVYSIIESYDGVLPFTDKADKDVISREFGLSKNAFKRAVGRLLKEGRIEITEKNIIIR